MRQADESRSHVEVCAEGGVIVQQLARRIAEDGGAALIADYGHDGTKTDTFRVRRDVFLIGAPAESNAVRYNKSAHKTCLRRL